jgi:hypothetical protein
MLDTIEILEAIGSDASLRYASTVELTAVLEQARASDALTSAVQSGDDSYLSKELGVRTVFVPQAVQTFLSADID